MTSGIDAEPPAGKPLPPGLDLLWGRRERGKRGPRPGLSPEAIVRAAVAVADAEGLEAVSMARVARKLGFTTMSLYRHVASKDELLQLMWNASALGAETLVLEGEDWRARLRHWAVVQREMLDRHPWVNDMPLAAPPAAPNSLHFVERALAAMDGTGLADHDRLRVIGLLTSYTLADARMAHDARRAAAPAWTFDELLREVADQETYPRLHRVARSENAGTPPDEHEEFLFGVDRILDGIESYMARSRS